jgi:hypothetical protein
MYSKQSSSEQFMLYLKSLGGSEADITGPACVVSDEDTVETVISRLRMEQYTRGSNHVEPSILQASAQVLISRRDERDPVHQSGDPQGGTISWISTSVVPTQPGKPFPRRV